MHEMPLVIFTLLEQVALGAFVVLCVLRLRGKLDARVGFKTGVVVCAVAVVAMVASLFHLGQPLRAINVMRGLGSSWLSREVLFFVLFTVAIAAYAVLEKLGRDKFARIAAIAGAVFGVLALVSTTICYMQPGVEAWNSIATPAQFVLTTVVAGVPLGLALVRSFEGGAPMKWVALWWAIFVILFATQCVMRYFFFADIVTLTSTIPLA